MRSLWFLLLSTVVVGVTGYTVDECFDTHNCNVDDSWIMYNRLKGQDKVGPLCAKACLDQNTDGAIASKTGSGKSRYCGLAIEERRVCRLFYHNDDVISVQKRSANNIARRESRAIRSCYLLLSTCPFPVVSNVTTTTETPPLADNGELSDSEKAKIDALGIQLGKREKDKPEADKAISKNVNTDCFLNSNPNKVVKGSPLFFYIGRTEFDETLPGCMDLCLKTKLCKAVNFDPRSRTDHALCITLSAICTPKVNCLDVDPKLNLIYWERGQSCPETPALNPNEEVVSDRAKDLGVSNPSAGQPVVTPKDKVQQDADVSNPKASTCFNKQSTTNGVKGNFLYFYAGRKEFDETVNGCMDLCLKSTVCKAINYFPKTDKLAADCILHSNTCLTTNCIQIAATEYWERIPNCTGK